MLHSDIIKEITETDPMIVDVNLLSIYKGSMTYRIEIRDLDDNPLTKIQIDRVINSVISRLQLKGINIKV